MKALLAFVLAVASPWAMAAMAIGVGIGSLLSMIIYLVIVGVIFWAIWWFIGFVGVPEPFNKVIRVILGLVALLIVINLLLSFTGNPIFVTN